ncbi:Uncharacterised protein [Shigella sonnei]|nr:Uncharacterised protein [Shigella sonnei]CSS67630.1 Uncharacterised protein [Shigella sonnei]
MGKRTRPCEREKNLSGLRQVSFNFAHNGVSTFYCIADVDAHDGLASKTLFKLDADIFGQNHHISARHIFRSQFIFQTN